jgi:hypothetical protein
MRLPIRFLCVFAVCFALFGYAAATAADRTGAQVPPGGTPKGLSADAWSSIREAYEAGGRSDLG